MSADGANKGASGGFGPADAKAWADVTYTPTSDSVVDLAQLTTVATLWASLGIGQAQFFSVAFQIAMTCADAHASSLTVLGGNCTAVPTVPLKAAAGLVKSVTTLRQFCRYYAKFVWNWRIEHKMPPANWAACGYTEETKYAAFDFFDGVTSTAALDPPTGLVRAPTEKELSASQTVKFVALTKASASGFVSNLAEVTKGRAQANPLPAIAPP
ncbi:MAG: putative coat protein [Hainan sediment alphaflexivirus 1]|nr:MAG: putative coat protein [Hainan sediment alphaflexivirus 1]